MRLRPALVVGIWR